MEKEKKCKKCGGPIKPKSTSMFCSHTCRSRYYSKKNYYAKRDDSEFKAKQSQRIKDWYNKNKEKQIKTILDNYKENKPTWAIRSFNNQHKDLILAMAPKSCYICGSPDIKIIGIGHNKNIEKPLLFRHGTPNEKIENNKKVYDYVQKLRFYCSKGCLGAARRK